jgi:hypothetical protein
MNDRHHDDFDPELHALFEREHTHLPAEPFCGAALRAVAAERKRAALRARIALAAAVVALVLVSPLLIYASSWLAPRLDAALALASGWLASPFGMAAAALCVLAALATKWARVW